MATKSSLTGSRNFKQQSILKHPKKLEGFDPSCLEQSKTTTLPQDTKTFVSNQGIEQDYINGLQDEIKLLEYEIKLLKEKETEEMDNFSHFFQFINDGAPINDNIIAIKNLYNLTQKELENKKKEMEDKVINGTRSIELLKKDIADLETKFKELNDTISVREFDYDSEYVELLRKQLEEKYQYEMKKPLKDILVREAREAQSQILKYKRVEEKSKLEAPKLQHVKKSKQIKIRNQLDDIEEEILELKKETEFDLSGEKFRQKKQELDFLNQQIEKKIIITTSEVKQSETRQAELNFLLKQAAIDRAKEQREKRKLANKIHLLKEEYEDLIKKDEDQIEEMVKEKEKETMRQLEMESEAIKDKGILIAQERIQKYENQNQQLVEDKMECQMITNELEFEKDRYEKELKEAEAELLKLKIENDILNYKNKVFEEKLPLDRTQKDKLAHTNVENDKIIQKLEEKIATYHRQLKLIQEIKNFDFEEIKMASESNKQVNGSIHQLVQKWSEINNDHKNASSLQFHS